MTLAFLKAGVREHIMFSWAAIGLWVFISAFLWAPSRDGLQVIYLLAFFLPMLLVLPFRKPGFNEYGGWMTVTALLYAGFSAISTLWGESRDLPFFLLQWCVLAVWLCGASLLFSRREMDIQRYLPWFIGLGVVVTIVSILHYYLFEFGKTNVEVRLYGWNVFRNANEIGSMCGVIALLSFTVALQSTSLKRAWLFFCLSAVASVGLVASFSRGSLLAFVLMAMVAVLLIRPALKVWLPPILMGAVSVALVFIFLPLDKGFQGRGAELGNRAILWAEILRDCQKNILLGIGMAKNTTITIPNVDIFNHAHNAWLDTFYRTGLIGLTLVVAHLIFTLKHFSRSIQLLPLYLWLGYGCICSLFDSRCFFWEIGAKWFLYWIPAGLIAAVIGGALVRSSQVRLEQQ